MTRNRRSVPSLCLGLLLAAPLLASEMTVSGVVHDSAGRPFPGAQVTLLPVLPNLNAQRLRLAGGQEPEPLAAATTGADGRFALASPAAGVFEVAIHAQGHLAVHYSPLSLVQSMELPPAELHSAVAAAFEVVGPAVRGRVTAPDGRPVPGATLMATPLSGAPPLPSFRADGAEARTASDPTGRFELSGLRPGISYAIEIRAAGWAPKRLPVARLSQTTPADWISDLGTIVLAPEARIEGRVVDQDGKPIPGAAVRRDGAPPVLSDARGRFTLSELGRSDEVDLRVEHPAFLPAELPGVAAPTASPLEIILQPAARLAGWIVDESGQGIAEAAVTLRAPDIAPGVAEPRQIQEERSTASDRDGRFELDAVAPGLYEVTVHAEGFQRSPDLPLQVSTSSPPEELRVVLARGATLEGRVLTGKDEPVAGARVSATSATGVSDELGRYRLDGVPPGRRTVRVYQPTYGRLSRTTEIAAGDNRLDLVFEPGQRVGGRVIDDDGEPVAGAAVRLLGGGLPGETLAKSGPQGGFVFPHVLKGRYRVQAARGSFPPLSDSTAIVVADAPIEDLELVLARGATLTGRIRGLAADELAVVELTAERRQGGSAAAGVEATGSFEIQGLAPGTWHVRAALQNGARQASGVVEIPPGARSATLDLEFRRGLTLAGRVLHSGAPLAGASVTVTEHSQSSARQMRTSFEGRFRLLDLEPGWYRVEVTHPAELLTEIQDLHLARDEELTIDIATARVSGRVVSGEEPLADAMVVMQRLLSAGDGGLLAVGTDSRGSFRLARVTAGRYRLTVRKAGYAQLVQELEVQSGIELGALDLAPAP